MRLFAIVRMKYPTVVNGTVHHTANRTKAAGATPKAPRRRNGRNWCLSGSHSFWNNALTIRKRPDAFTHPVFFCSCARNFAISPVYWKSLPERDRMWVSQEDAVHPARSHRNAGAQAFWISVPKQTRYKMGRHSLCLSILEYFEGSCYE